MTDIPEKFLQTLQELGPQELDNIFKVIKDIPYYNDVYKAVTRYILARYKNLDIDKIEKAGDIIDQGLSDIDYGQRLLVYNKLDEPFIDQIWIEYKLTEKINGKRYPLKEINDMILALHPNININNINNFVKDTDIKANNLNLTKEEKFLLFNNLAHVYLIDMIKTLNIND